MASSAPRTVTRSLRSSRSLRRSSARLSSPSDAPLFDRWIGLAVVDGMDQNSNFVLMISHVRPRMQNGRLHPSPSLLARILSCMGRLNGASEGTRDLSLWYRFELGHKFFSASEGGGAGRNDTKTWRLHARNLSKLRSPEAAYSIV